MLELESRLIDQDIRLRCEHEQELKLLHKYMYQRFVVGLETTVNLFQSLCILIIFLADDIVNM